MEVFDPKIHICKFGFNSYDQARLNQIDFNISADLYQCELVIEIYEKFNNDAIATYGYELTQNKVNAILPLIRWEDYEKYRDLPE